jgi:AcrR family transcriptional regulator
MPGNQEQKEAIISVATGLFSRFGLEKTTMEDIAKAARKGKSTLYYYFKSKEDVFAEVIKREISGLKGAMLEAVEREKDPGKKLKVFVDTRLRYLTQKEDQYISVKDEYLRHYGFIRNLTADYSDWEIETIKGIVEEGRDRGLFSVTAPAAVARAVFFALKGLEYPWATNMTRDETRKSVNILVDILLKGISKN